MSRGPGAIEVRIGDLFAATRDRALSVDELADYAFGLNGKPASRAQRLSTIRAAHRVTRRVIEMDQRRFQIMDEIAARIQARGLTDREDSEYYTAQRADPQYPETVRLREAINRIGLWRRGNRFSQDSRESWLTTTIGKGRGTKLWFHPADCPAQVWAVQIDHSGVHWFDAEVVKITSRFVTVRYGGELGRLHRENLFRWWAWWRGVMFVACRTGRIGSKLTEIWWERYGAAGSVPPAMRMPLAEAIALLGVPQNYTRDDVIAAFRREVKKAHPDAGGTAEMFRKLVEARDRLLAAIGTSAPPPKPPSYYPSGSKVVYRSGRSSRKRRLGHTRRVGYG